MPNKKIDVIEGDIRQQKVETIVNAANESLLGGGGVDGAIHRAAGPELLAECRSLNGCPTGQAKITGGYNLYARWVIHTVGPIWRGGNQNEDDLLAQCYKNSMALAEEYYIKTIAFPSISTGVYSFPMGRAARIAVTEIKHCLEQESQTEQVLLVCFGQKAYHIHQAALQEIMNM